MQADLQDALLDLGAKLQGWTEATVLLLPNLVVAVLVLFLAWVVGRGLGALAHRGMGRITDASPLTELVTRLVKVVVYAAGIIVALSVLQLDKAAVSLLAGAGIVALVVGFAFQDLSANFIAGVAMALRRPFKVGHIIETNGLTGVVQSVALRSTQLKTFQGQTLFIPNRKLFEEPLTNFSDLGRRRVDLAVGVSYGDDLRTVRDVTLEAVRALDRAPGTEVELFFEGFGDSSINFEVLFWVPFARQPDYLRARSEAVIAVKEAYDRHDITIPFPIRTLDFGIVGGEKLEDHLTAWSGRRGAGGG